MAKAAEIFDKAKVLSTVKELPSDTKVKHWLVQTDKNTFYSVVFYFMPRIGNMWSVFNSDKKGKRKSSTPIVNWPATSASGLSEIGAVVNKFLDENVELPESTEIA